MNFVLNAIFFLGVLVVFQARGFAQTRLIDSLEIAAANTNDPLKQFEYLDRLMLAKVGFSATNVDSLTALKMVDLAQQLENDSLLAISYNWIGSYFSSNKGDNTTGLEYYFKALPLAINSKDKRRISSLYFDIAFAYNDLQNEEAAHFNNLKGGENLPDSTSDMFHFMVIQFQMNEANYYLSIDQIDSAEYYAKEMQKANEYVGSTVMEYVSYAYLAAAQARRGNVQLANDLFARVLTLNDTVKRNQARLWFYSQYIPFLLTQGKVSQAKQQARTLLEHGYRIENNQYKLLAAASLREIFELENQLDSAYFYSRMEADVNGLIFSQSNKNRIQALAFNELLRSTEEKNREAAYRNELKQYGLLTGLGVFLLVAFILFRNNRQTQKTNKALNETLIHLKTTQSQLVQSEKMASLGELTAGIAHEIQNPLNFVNNFSEMNVELIKEIQDERQKTQDKRDEKLESELLSDIGENEEKIKHHGQRASSIVKGMLEHSRTGDGQKEPTDINALADEYLRLAYHGLRAKDKSFNAEFKTEFDPNLPKVNVIPQDIGRVLLNLINNAFFAVNEKVRHSERSEVSENYKPLVTVSTSISPLPAQAGSSGGGKGEEKVVIQVHDNGSGIPEQIRDKIFQPFFTTKATGEGTGLGLSLSYDIVTKGHGGTLKVESSDDGTRFTINLPSN